MNQFFDLKRLHYFRKQEEIVLAFLAAVGFAFGIYSAFISGLNIVSLMRIAASGCVSIVRLLVLILLPFSFTAVAAFLKKPFLLYLLIFLKSFGYAFCMCGICISFGQAGWLICFQLLFTDSAVIASIIFFAVRNASGFRENVLYELGTLLCICFIVGIIDITVVFPAFSTVLI